MILALTLFTLLFSDFFWSFYTKKGLKTSGQNQNSGLVMWPSFVADILCLKLIQVAKSIHTIGVLLYILSRNNACPTALLVKRFFTGTATQTLDQLQRSLDYESCWKPSRVPYIFLFCKNDSAAEKNMFIITVERLTELRPNLTEILVNHQSIFSHFLFRLFSVNRPFYFICPLVNFDRLKLSTLTTQSKCHMYIKLLENMVLMVS